MRRDPLKRLVSGALALLIIGTGVTAVVLSEQPASAVSAPEMLRGFDPADIISDGVMFNPKTMSADAIQTFLEGKVKKCRAGYTCLRNYRQDTKNKSADPMCAAYTGRKNETAAQIISRVGTACGVNPQVILVTLQKEQSLVTDDWPSARQWRSATGYGCPDTAPCDSDYFGFFNQVYKAAWAFKRYTSPKGTEGTGWTRYNWFPVGRPSGVLYNPNPACGAKSITIKNKATAVLYYFTPYQPNQAALAAGFLAGNGCSAYGNRNFFLYFTTWFGSTHYSATGAIGAYWRAHGGSSGPLGQPLQNVVTVKDGGGGSRQRFSGGTVYSSSSGTYLVAGTTRSAYNGSGGAGVLGFPRGEALARSQNGGGSVQTFAKGAVYSSEDGAYSVAGDIGARYARAGAQAGSLGWPTSAEKRADGVAQQTFSRGSIVSVDGRTSAVTGSVLTKWLQRGGTGGTLGAPTAEAAKVTRNGRSGTVQPFTGGQVLVLDRVYTVTGAIARNFTGHDGVQGALGWPTSVAMHAAAYGGGWSQRFDGGTVLYSTATGAHRLSGAELRLYDLRGGTAGTLGWPGSRVRVKDGIGGAVTTFTSGRMYSSSAGTAAVRENILKRYLKDGGPAGRLGWPRAGAKREQGVMTQRFQFGRITWTPDGGAVVHTS